ncbi:MAG: ParM/StbA family protein [Anaerolineaceae bacterium]|jgi:hypothetical protein|nr:ParM/StbA family protein [Anaerolineaceae bacterium]
MNIIALDPGFGNTNVCIDGKVHSIQSAIARPQDLGLVAIGMKQARHGSEITLEGQTFTFGEGAWNQGSLHGSLDYTSLASLERRALFLGTATNLLKPGRHNCELLVIGLPVPLLKDKTQAESIFSQLKRWKGTHPFQKDGEEYVINIERMKVLAQPVGAYANWLLDEELSLRRSGRKAEVAILDIGFNTLDLYVVQGGQVLPRFVGGGKVGVRRLLNLLNEDDRELEELDSALRHRKIHPSTTHLEMWLNEILAAMERTWPNLKRFSAVIPTGGGAVLLDNLLRNALIAKGAAIFWPEDPINANVIGLWKWGTYGSHATKTR